MHNVCILYIIYIYIYIYINTCTIICHHVDTFVLFWLWQWEWWHERVLQARRQWQPCVLSPVLSVHSPPNMSPPSSTLTSWSSSLLWSGRVWRGRPAAGQGAGSGSRLHTSLRRLLLLLLLLLLQSALLMPPASRININGGRRAEVGQLWAAANQSAALRFSWPQWLAIGTSAASLQRTLGVPRSRRQLRGVPLSPHRLHSRDCFPRRPDIRQDYVWYDRSLFVWCSDNSDRQRCH